MTGQIVKENANWCVHEQQGWYLIRQIYSVRGMSFIIRCMSECSCPCTGQGGSVLPWICKPEIKLHLCQSCFCPAAFEPSSFMDSLESLRTGERRNWDSSESLPGKSEIKTQEQWVAVVLPLRWGATALLWLVETVNYIPNKKELQVRSSAKHANPPA